MELLRSRESRDDRSRIEYRETSNRAIGENQGERAVRVTAWIQQQCESNWATGEIASRKD